MAQRKEVFQSKVLQKLYPAVSKLEKESTASSNVEALNKKTIVSKTIQRNSSIGNTSTAPKHIYTVIPPPADYKADSEKSVTQSEPENIKSAEDTDVNSGNGSSDKQALEPEKKIRRKRRRKRKDAALALNQAAANEGEERLSKNKKRKLKKKRHKDKLLSMGLVPRATAVEFTFQREGLRPTEGEEEKEEEEGSCQTDPTQDQDERS